MGNVRVRCAWGGRRASAIATLLLAPVATAGAASAPVAAPAPLLAQGVVAFPAGVFQWRVTAASLEGADAPTPAPEPATFVLARSGTVDVAGTWSSRLATGEATMLPAHSGASLSTGTSADYWTLEIIGPLEGASATDGAFSVGAARREVDLVQGTVAPGEELTLPSGDVPVLVLSSDGTVVVASDDGGQPTLLPTGAASTLDGTVTVTAADAPATFVAAVIGPQITDGIFGPAPAAPAAAPTSVDASPSPPQTSPPTAAGQGQTIDFTDPGTNHRWSGDPYPFTLELHATSSTGQPVTFSVVNGECNVAGSTLSTLTTGACTIVASLPGAGPSDPTSASREFKVSGLQVGVLLDVPSSAPASQPVEARATASVSGGVAFETSLMLSVLGGDCAVLGQDVVSVTDSNPTASFTIQLGTAACTIKAQPTGRFITPLPPDALRTIDPEDGAAATSTGASPAQTQETIPVATATGADST